MLIKRQSKKKSKTLGLTTLALKKMREEQFEKLNRWRDKDKQNAP